MTVTSSSGMISLASSRGLTSTVAGSGVALLELAAAPLELADPLPPELPEQAARPIVSAAPTATVVVLARIRQSTLLRARPRRVGRDPPDGRPPLPRPLRISLPAGVVRPESSPVARGRRTGGVGQRTTGISAVSSLGPA
ncbi:hypothetical protein GCM10027055_11540 [Janibacter alkaliphilus]